MTEFRSLFALLLSTALLVTGHGLHYTLLPLRAAENGFSATQIGLTGSVYFAGFMTGCFINPHIIARVGHIRCFAALVALFLASMLLLDVFTQWWLWLVLRFVIGVMMCGAYTVIESWLTDQTPMSARGRVLAIYTFLALSAMVAGQLLVNLAPISSSTPFIILGIILALSIVPVSLTRSLAPAPISRTRLSFMLLYRRSRTAFAGGLVSGLVMGSFWSLGAVYALNMSGESSFAPLFITACVAGGALGQYPIGVFSDRIDRRYILAALCLLTAASSLLLAFQDSKFWLIAFAGCFGASANALYPLSLAKASDNSERDEFVLIGSSVLLLHALGAALAPLAVGPLMNQFGPQALFSSLSILSVLFGLYIVLQPRSETAVAAAVQGSFIAVGVETVPASFEIDPRSTEDMSHPIEAAHEPLSTYDAAEVAEENVDVSAPEIAERARETDFR
ncbi:major facilitator superfamily protein [Luminiphilus syltensis NOR5-1B]|uniref:Major facilitator superfamily protein n=1 Tax=Luminiphilus syltensis NOR5-1B TaxID=565045 RepID=B8KT02_9GAMM|nr:MFS transporter [Luminiphilus syltensis]EED36346.1 major facilitator superfamily protein [Luminiphilus syltensis NOR5-1B]